ncbi:MAG: hypothetical protein AB8C95_13160 [Phycisphaeraceae bacterium]
MNNRTLSFLSILTLGLAFAISLPTAAGTIEHDGWLSGEEADKAIELAIEHNVPIAVMRTYRTTTCPKCIGAARQMAASKSTKKMVRVMLYVNGDESLKSDAASKLMRKAHGQVKDPSGWIPDLYFLMPDGRALGFVPYEDSAKTESEAKAVSQMAAWIKGVDKTLAKADKDADKGRFESALKAVDEIIDQDAKINHLIRIQVGAIDKKEKMPETPVSLIFPGLKDTKVAEYKALAMSKIDEAKKLIEKEELRDAQRMLKTLSRIPDDFEAKAKAAELMEEVVELLKAS